MVQPESEDSWSRMGPHDEYLELCAVSTSGNLSEEETAKLEQHLASCTACRKALKEYRASADIALPLLAASSSDPLKLEALGIEPAEREFRRRLEKARQAGESRAESATSFVAGLEVSALRVRRHWTYAWLAFGAAVALGGILGIYVYRVGLQVAGAGPRTTQPPLVVSAPVVQHEPDTDRDRSTLVSQISERDKAIDSLRRQLEKQTADSNSLRQEKASLETSAAKSEDERRQLLADQATVNAKLESAETALAKSQKEYEVLRNQRSETETTTSALQSKVSQLSAELQDKNSMIDQQQELLSHDRDIRELMASRDLYIAEVFDVAKTGATQKPKGRVFFTKGKSLIFYAFDLDKQAGFRTASTFQAWGQRGSDRQSSLSLGIFYQDNASKKRWVLKSNDEQKLDEIDAVFVTVEPHGGSEQPSGKPLLFAYLKVRPNHP